MKTKNSIPVWPFFLIVTFFVCFSISDAYDSSKGTMWVPAVATHAGQYSVRNEFPVTGNNTFVAGGGSGVLMWHPESLGQAAILKMTDTKNLNFMDCLHWMLLYAFVAVFYMMTRGKGSPDFPKNVTKGFRIIFFIIAMTPAIEYEKYKLLNKYVQHITGGQFRLPEETIQWYYFYLGIMLIVLSRFIEKALEVKTEEQAAA